MKSQHNIHYWFKVNNPRDIRLNIPMTKTRHRRPSRYRLGASNVVSELEESGAPIGFFAKVRLSKFDNNV